jgi:hypothetical protein
MTKQSDKELQIWLEERESVDYSDEEVQKRTVIASDMGHSITLYDWIHRNDNPPVEYSPPDWEKFNADWLEEFRKLMVEG